MDSGIGVVAVSAIRWAGQSLPLGERQPVLVELAERQQGRAADRDVAVGDQKGGDAGSVGPAGPRRSIT